MATSINLPDSLKKDFTDFLGRDGIDLEIAQDSSGLVSVTEGEETKRREGTLSDLYTHGWISCEVARQVAENLSISYGDTGKILNFLDIKVRNCGLGCF